jgi:eukaryotic-like serine/threonine-protein kinase
MKLEAGARLGPYEVVEAIGAGGMGEVYRARDPRIGRDVAIKVLPESIALDPERLKRFEQEARAAGAMNHPNLVTLHDMGSVDGSPYLVMELLEGETLREWLGETRPASGGADARRGGAASGSGRARSVRRVLEIATQIANGLAAAHDRQIVHRDLKPENVFITSDGMVKILDFGLAKLTGPVPGGQSEAETEKKNTAPGTVMGTVGYMSPEQVRGQTVDHRTDIFAFGSILYEMLAGRRAFHGTSAADTMSAILKEDPPELGELVPAVPPSIDRIVRHCLEKSPERRFQSARDLAFDLEAIEGSSGLSGPSHAAKADAGTLVRRVSVVLAAIAGLLAAGLVGFRLASRESVAPHTSAAGPQRAFFSQLTHRSGTELFPTLAPDGKTFAFVSEAAGGEPDIFLQRVDGQAAINLTRSPGTAETQPVFSPDGSFIAFRVEGDDGGIFVMGATGESRRRVTDSGWNPAWSPDGRFLVFADEAIGLLPEGRIATSALWVVEIASGQTRRLPVQDAVQPAWSPRGHRIAYWGLGRGGQRDIWTIAADADTEGQAVRVTEDPHLDWNPVWSADGEHLLFGSDRDGTRNLWRVPIDETTGEVRGAPEPLSLPVKFAGHFSVAGSLIAFASIAQTESIHRGVLDRRRGRIEPGPAAVSGSMTWFNVAVSRDGEWIVASNRERRMDLFLLRADGSEIRQLTNDVARDRGASFSADGRHIFFYSDRDDGTYQVWRIGVDGSSLTKITDVVGVDVWYPKPSPDGTRLVVFGVSGMGFVDLTASLPVKDIELPPWEDPATRPRGTDRGSGLPWSPDGTRILSGVARIEDGLRVPGLMVYVVESRRWDRIDDASWPIDWVDDDNVLVSDDEGVAILRLSTGEKRRIDTTPEAVRDSYFVAREGDVVLYLQSVTEADVWLADFEKTN